MQLVSAAEAFRRQLIFMDKTKQTLSALVKQRFVALLVARVVGVMLLEE